MPLQYDPEYLKALEPLLPMLSKRTELKLDEIQSSRSGREAGIAALMNTLPEAPDVVQTEYTAEAADGHLIPIVGFAKSGLVSKPGPAILHFHGGGMVMGSAQMVARRTAMIVKETSVPIFSVNYRLAPEYTGTTPAEDCYTALIWLRENAQRHNVDHARIALFGESAGGGLAAGVALMARDRNLQPPVAKQILIYPMLDDLNMKVNKEMEPLAFWKTADNITAWTALLGNRAGEPNADISPYTAPTRAKSLSDLPPTYIDVGELDIFREEDIKFACRLMEENISTELHLYPGVPHAFEVVAPNIRTTKEAYKNRIRALMSF